MKSMFIFTFW